MNRLKQFVTDPEDVGSHFEYLKSIFGYQFGEEVSDCVFRDNQFFKIQRSVNTWRIRNVLYDGELFLVLRPQDGLFSLTLKSASLIKQCAPFPDYRVAVKREVKDVIQNETGNVFAKHVVEVDRSLRSGDEAIIVSEDDELIGVGKMRLSGSEVMEYKRGVAVSVRERWKKRK
ncbi:pseudouridine synthase [Metallosphaera tengchongensis]|uniref:Pseudouridine synthase n=1 Tax=Metallosphaera tengchongensis TaxID=1532350 RepID=A0A6N0NT38_9CREN|nr:PUA domain-containing protein [Metallosphaera tengchongensis]QKQ99871.1 pseudouridine synthase [Metallosphaera tengchongensis]